MSKTFLLHISHLESRAARCIRDKGRQSIYIYKYHCCRIKIFLASLSLVIVLRAVQTSQTVQQVSQQKQSLGRQSWDLVVGMFRTVFRRRSGWLTACILLQLLAYTMYYISFRECKLWYLYVREGSI